MESLKKGTGNQESGDVNMHEQDRGGWDDRNRGHREKGGLSVCESVTLCARSCLLAQDA